MRFASLIVLLVLAGLSSACIESGSSIFFGSNVLYSTCSTYVRPYVHDPVNPVQGGITNSEFVLLVGDDNGLSDLSGGWCYQETATSATGCGGLATGSYTLGALWDDSPVDGSMLIDGDWTTRACTEGSSYLYVNYSKPEDALPSSLWQYKDDNSNGNLSIPSDCWSEDPLQFYVNVTGGEIDWNCINSSGKIVRIFASMGAGWCAFEEGVWWDYGVPDSLNLSVSTGAVTHVMESCYNPVTVDAYSLNVTCNVSLDYFDVPGSWSINASVVDAGGHVGYNDTESFTYNPLTAIGVTPSSLTFGMLTPLQVSGASDDPLVVYNQGNTVINNVTVTSYNLTSSSGFVPATSFNVSVSDAAGTGVSMVEAVPRQVPSFSVNPSAGASGNLYWWVGVPAGVPVSSYSSSQSWVVSAYV